MIARWIFYIRLGFLDLVRLRATTQHHVIIVAGICLPILMLLGLKRGHVAQLRQALVTSPSGRQVTFWSAQKGELLTRESVDRLQKQLQKVEVIIPDKQRLVRVSRTDQSGKESSIEAVTLFSTRKGDPLLQQLNVEAPASGSRKIILGSGVAKHLGLSPRDRIQIGLKRGVGASEEKVELECELSAVVPTETENALIGYADINLLDDFERFVRGYRVNEMGWASMKQSASDTYSSYLLFCEKTSSLSEEDLRLLHERGFSTEDITDAIPEPLLRLMKLENVESLSIWELYTRSSRTNPKSRLHVAPSEISEQTSADDVVIPWNNPRNIKHEGKEWVLVGLSLPKRTWLREYFIDPESGFSYDEDPFQLYSSKPADPAMTKLLIPLNESQQLQVNFSRHSQTSPQSENGAPVVVSSPSSLLAWLSEFDASMVEYDSAINLFVPRPETPVYDRARLYASTIDDVPLIVRTLSEEQFAVMSETGRISEIQGQDSSLQLLVLVVASGVFLFGIITVFSILSDSTDRKRCSIGILRVMGMSREGVFLSVVIRAGIIAILAASVSVACSAGLAAFLAWSPGTAFSFFTWKPVITITVLPTDILVVAVGALVCSTLGALYPAWNASTADPFEAIVEGKFR